ncbi:hypothetical protein M8C21_013333 [Ambrosia artemisiifolia]|uniref:Uncharacterized protein n=1 Tax=Ambrosia artemisiifolia TaxID=4212 RepID=A0AAD5BYU1_AMBAR|nr:hypothetical protein M8C21_013333 [Ambrosia artemisiifolia]
MKKLLAILILLSTLLLSSCQFRPNPIRDTDSNILRSGTNYYIVPAMHGVGGGLTLARDSELCPLEVVQEVSEVRHGLPASFIPANKDGIIRESIDLNIKFNEPNTCAPNTVWRVNLPNAYGQRTLSSRGILGRPGKGTIDNWFKIKKYEDRYKLVHCPSVCHTCKPVCEDIGITINEKGRRSLVLNNNKPLKVMFKKA